MQSTALIIQSCGVLSVSWNCCKADFADSETMKAEDKEADWSLGPFPKVLFDPGKLSHLLTPTDSPVSALMCCLDTGSAFSSLVSMQRCMWATWHCTLVGISSVHGVMCGWVSKGFLKKELVVEGSVRPQHQVNVCAVRFEL